MFDIINLVLMVVLLIFYCPGKDMYELRDRGGKGP